MSEVMGRDPEDPKQIVVTGFEVVSPLGIGVETAMENLFAGRHAITKLPEEFTECYPQLKVKVAANINGFNMNSDPLLDYKPSERLRHHESTEFALYAGTGALRMAGIVGNTMPEKGSGLSVIELHNSDKDPQQAVDPERIAICFGTGVGGTDRIGQLQYQLDAVGSNGKRQSLKPYAILEVLPERGATALSMRHGIKGPVYIVTAACASAMVSVIDGIRMLEEDDADVVVVGGFESQISPIGLALFDAATALDTNSDPEQASRPFDKAHAGFVMGKGACALVIEQLWHANKRGAPILAKIPGYGQISDAGHPTAPTGQGAERTMSKAIAMAALVDPQYGIGAHATGTPVGDAVEARAIASVFDIDKEVVGVSSTKCATGHLLGADGAFGLIAGIFALHRREIPPSLKLDDPIDEIEDWPMSPNKATPVPNMNAYAKNAFGFGGSNTTVIVTL